MWRQSHVPAHRRDRERQTADLTHVNPSWRKRSHKCPGPVGTSSPHQVEKHTLKWSGERATTKGTASRRKMDFNWYKAVWYFIHFLFTIVETIYWSCAGARRALIGLLATGDDDAASVLREAGDPKTDGKVPQHVTVLVDGEQPSYKDLAKLIVWSMATGISFISFYDSEGKLKKNESELRHAVEKVLPRDNRIIWHSEAAGYKNGYSGKKIHLKIFSTEDGQSSVANVCKDLIHSKELDVETLDRCLRKEYEFPDPSLGVYCGDYLNLRGYPPWQIRLTEFFPLGSHHDITYSQYQQVLRCYDKCEQRVGK